MMGKWIWVIALIIPAGLPAQEVIINEVSVNNGTWVELKNQGASPVNLKGWVIANSQGSDVLPDYTLQAGAYVVIAASRSMQADIYLADGSVGSGLASAADMLVLQDDRGNTVDMVNWGKANPFWPNYRTDLWSYGPDMAATGDIARIPDALDRDMPNDFRSMTDATPGQENSYPMGLDTPSWGKIKALFSESRFK